MMENKMLFCALIYACVFQTVVLQLFPSYISINCNNVSIRMKSLFIQDAALHVNQTEYLIKLCVSDLCLQETCIDHQAVN